MVDTLALEKVYADVQTDFIAQEKDTVFAFGIVERTKQLNQGPGGGNRIVVHPGTYPDGNVGKVDAPMFPGRLPRRPLHTLHELFTVLTWAHDASYSEDAFAQWKAARLLFDDFVAALYRSSHGTYGFVSARWSHGKDRNERRFGNEIESVWTIQSMIPDFEQVAVRPVTPDITTTLEGGSP
jgi:hypothetical protein